MSIVKNCFKEIIEELIPDFFKRKIWKDSYHFRNSVRSRRYFDNVREIELSSIFKKNDIQLIIDVGANKGQFARSIRGLGYTGKIFSFEPFPDSFKFLSHISKKDKNWYVYNFALGSEQSIKSLNIYRDSALNSFLSGDGSGTDRYKNSFRVNSKIEVEVKTLNNVFMETPDLKNAENIFLKLDTQGYDLEVFKGANEIIHLVKYLYTEMSIIPIYRETKTYTETLEIYKNEGFRPLSFLPLSRDIKNDSVMVEFDCLLIK